jgi:hypothetical protein
MKDIAIEYIGLFSSLSITVPLVVYAIKFRNLSRQHHLLAALIMLSAVSDFASYFRLSSPQIFFNLYGIIEFAIISTFYYVLVYKKKAQLILLMAIGVYLSVLLFSLLKHDFRENYTALWSVGSLIIALHGVAYIFSIPHMTIERYFDRDLLSNLILAGSSFCYAIVSFLIFALADLIFERQDPESIDAFWSLHNIFNIMKNIGFALGFYYVNKREIYITLEQLERIAKKLEEGD